MNKPFLRSVNLKDDIAVPSRLDHYHPTSRSLPVAQAVLSGGATMVIAAYGSGKSLAAGIGALAVANKPENRDLIRTLAKRIEKINPAFAAEYAGRVNSGRRGRVVTLSGYVRDVAASIAASLGLGAHDDIEDVLSAVSSLKGVDRIAIVWDEFGRHLEGLITEGRARDLDAVQRLSEWTTRSASPSASLTLLLHQNVLAYAGNLNQTTRNEWRKIEGRFNAIRFVEDSRELYDLIATVIAERPHGQKPDRRVIKDLAADAVEARWFDGIDDAKDVADLLAKAYPITAGALQVLPRLVARVAQNERSLFAFIEGVDLTGPIGLEEVYLAFSEAMRSDVGIGGVHRRWIEAESARSKTTDEVEREILAAAFLLQLGTYGERRHLPRRVLELAVRAKGYPEKRVKSSIDALIERKLVLYRKLNDDVSIWHGADIDIASRLRDEHMRRLTSFDLIGFLDKHHPATFLRPIRHNEKYGTARYLMGSYVKASGLSAVPKDPETGTWGRLIYVICDSSDDIRLAKKFAAACDLQRTILVIPEDTIPILDAALEIEGLSALRRDESLLSEDPLVAQELDELLAVARRHLMVMMHRLTTDRSDSAQWYAGGKVLNVNSERPAGIVVSALMDEWFPLTPRIVNDQVMRGTLSRQMQTARVRVILRLMEHSTEPLLGYGDDASAESSVYRTVLARTGIHVEEDGRGRFAEPEELADKGVRAVWEHVRDFFSQPGTRPLSEIVERLSAPPIGLPSGVIPIIVMAGYRAFGRVVSIYTDGIYVPDVLGFDSSRMFLEPARHDIVVHTDSKAVIDFLDGVVDIFAHTKVGPHDERIRSAHDAIRAWRSGIAEGAFRSRRMTDDARIFLRALNDASDPAEFLIETLPNRFGGKAKGDRNYDAALRSLETIRNVIDGLVDGYLRDAVEVMTQVMSVYESDDVIESIKGWVSCLDVDSLMKRNDLKMTDKGMLRMTRETLNGRQSPEMLARALSSVLLQRGIEKWQDDTKEQLRKELRECRLRIESAALDVSDPPEALAPIIEIRIRHLQEQLARIKGTGRRK